MNRFGPSRTLLVRTTLALVAGLLLAAAFPKFNVAGLAWIAPGLMLVAALGESAGGAFRLGYVAGLAFYLSTLYWLLLIPVKFAPILGWLALSAYLALYPATWVWLCWRLYPRSIARHSPALSGAGLTPHLDEFLSASWLQRLRWTLTCAALWVALEMVLGRFLSGFPWCFLGVSQHRMLPLIQIASFTGVYGAAFVVVWFSVALLGVVAVVLRAGQRARTWSLELLLPALALISLVTWGFRRVTRPLPADTHLRVALIQPSIPQTMIWNEAENATRFQQLLALTETALTNRADLLVWPEAAVPGLFLWNTNQFNGQTLFESITGLARRHRIWCVIGADDAAPNDAAPHGADFFNSSFLITPTGEIAARYRKQKLVIFGEYVPLTKWLPFLKYFTPIEGGFTPGSGPVPFRLTEPRANVGVLICFEDVFPNHTRHFVDDDTDFLLNLTNNGWFGESAAQWQHAANAAFRAIENGLPLVRCANNGLTCWVDAQGRFHDIYLPGTRDIYGVGFKIVDVPLTGSRAGRPTFYSRHGDAFGWACVAWSAASGLAAWRRQRMASIR